MATLSTDKQAAVIGALIEGSSIRSTERMTGVHRDTIMRLVERVGRSCERMMDEQIRHVPCRELQLDELWCFVGKKRNHVRVTDDPNRVGDRWTWYAVDRDTKLVPAYHVGRRDMYDADAFISKLRPRVEGRPQLSTDKLAAYRWAIFSAWGTEVDYGRIVKRYAVEPAREGRYSPPICIGVEKDVIYGDPDPERICTSHVERQNLNVRMQSRRFTRLTNGFSKKVENLEAAVALHFAAHNFVRVNRTIKTTPAVAAGIAAEPWKVVDLLELAY
jgi:IS1 family transposase